MSSFTKKLVNEAESFFVDLGHPHEISSNSH